MVFYLVDMENYGLQDRMMWFADAKTTREIPQIVPFRGRLYTGENIRQIRHVHALHILLQMWDR